MKERDDGKYNKGEERGKRRRQRKRERESRIDRERDD